MTITRVTQNKKDKIITKIQISGSIWAKKGQKWAKKNFSAKKIVRAVFEKNDSLINYYYGDDRIPYYMKLTPGGN